MGGARGAPAQHQYVEIRIRGVRSRTLGRSLSCGGHQGVLHGGGLEEHPAQEVALWRGTAGPPGCPVPHRCRLLFW